MRPERWREVKALFEEALCLRAEERGAFVAARTEDLEVRAEVESLLSVYEASPEFLEGAAPSLPAGEPAGLVGRHFGPWRLIREIGRGGMGVVWEARRADQEYEQRAAVKLLPFGLRSAGDVARFRDERQILARLNHPGIARLLDGGSAEDGSPYLVMEFVDGQRLDEWCDSRELPRRERLKLFLSVCSAVEYAHRHLVIHRDLKPANILVTQEGAPKLLDFGIARLLDADSGSTLTANRLLTPDYASPEQIRGESVTTASDVYSLGVLLYVLLTGRKPHGEDAQDPVELIRAVCEQDAAPPSAAAGERGGELRGELDAITLQALRKVPEERYPSIRALADDLRAWLEGRPVSAQAQPWWRRSAKWIRRNRRLSAAAGLALLSLVAGTAVSLWQAHVAHRERARAESRFLQVRRFSRSVLFELHDAIRSLPGATPARALLLAHATEFLDNLAKDAAGDVALEVELAEGFRRLGHVQGSLLSENLGRRDAAIESYRKAVRLGEQALAAAAKDLEAEIVLLGAYDDLADAFLAMRNFPEADAWNEKHRHLLLAMERDHPGDNRARDAAASSYSAVAYYRGQRNDLAGAQAYYRKAVDIYAALLDRGYNSKELRAQYPFALKRLGAILITENSLAAAETCYRQALKMEEAALRTAPADQRLRLDRTFTLSDLALILKKKKDYRQAAQIYQEVLQVRKEALASDSGDLRKLSMTANAAANLASVHLLERRYAEAVEFYREALRLREKAALANSGFLERKAAVEARVSLANSLVEAAANSAPSPARRLWVAEAKALLRQSAPLVEELGRGQNLNRSDQAMLADFRAVRDQLRTLPAAR